MSHAPLSPLAASAAKCRANVWLALCERYSHCRQCASSGVTLVPRRSRNSSGGSKGEKSEVALSCNMRITVMNHLLATSR